VSNTATGVGITEWTRDHVVMLEGRTATVEQKIVELEKQVSDLKKFIEQMTPSLKPWVDVTVTTAPECGGPYRIKARNVDDIPSVDSSSLPTGTVVSDRSGK
jgi:hypothetical protein